MRKTGEIGYDDSKDELVIALAGQKPPFTVAIDNQKNARPVSGVNEAGAIYEFPVDGGITRFMAVYDPDSGISSSTEIGPVRSARPYFARVASEHKSIYAHAGGIPDALYNLDNHQYNVYNLDALTLDGEAYFWRDDGRIAPYNLYTSIERLDNFRNEFDLDSGSFAWPWIFSDNPSSIDDIGFDKDIVEVNYENSDYNVRWIYNETDNVYYRQTYENGVYKNYMDKNSEQVSTVNLAIQYAYTDPFTEISQMAGEALVCREGKCVNSIWEKDDTDSNVKFYVNGGEEFEFKTGKLWINVTSEVSDMIPPIITLLGINPVELFVGDSYIEYGATAEDDIDGDITGEIIIDSSDVNTGTEGTYEVTYNVSDIAGNPAVKVTRTVNVVAIPKTDQTIIFDNPGDKVYGIAPFALSASASSGLIVAFSVVSGPATWDGSNLTLTGVGTVIIEASQTGNDTYNPAPDVEQTFNVAKATPTITWANPSDITEGTALSDTQLNATASKEGSFVYSPVAETVLSVGFGQTLSVEFTPTDIANYNNVSATVTINVIAAPNSAKTITSFIFTGLGSGIINETDHTIAVAVPYGTTTTNLTPTISITGDSVSPASGVAQDFTSSVTYTVTAEDTTTQDYIVTVTVGEAPDTTPPVITLLGDNPVDLSVGDSYTDAGATALDNIDGDITTSIVTVNPVNTNIAATYIITYNVSDAAGNPADEVTRTVNIGDVTPPDAITNLSVSNISNHTLKLNWTATGDDGNIGTAASYDIRYSTTEITNDNWSGATQISSPSAPNPKIAGTGQSVEVNGLSSGTTYYFAMKVSDEVPNESGISNVVSATTGVPSSGGGGPADTIPPTVAKLGNNSVDVVLPTGATDLVFSEELSSSSETAVQNALTAGADKILTYLWSGSTLAITATEATTFANDVVVNVSDLAGNAAELLLVDSALSDNQTAPDANTGDATANNGTSQVVITNPTQAVNVTVGSGATNPTIDVSSFITNGTGALPAITITSANANNTNVAIPASTVVTSADATWNGIIAAPTVTTVTLPETSGYTKALSTAIEIGFTGAKLSFDKAVRILLPGQAGKRAGYVRTGIAFTEITNTCAADNQATGDALSADGGADGECKKDVGSDLVIWTKHFTSFATYTQAAIPAPTPTPTPTSSSSGDGSYTPTTTVTNISILINGGATSATSTAVTLTLAATNATMMAISNTADFSGGTWETYAISKAWTLVAGDGIKTVYVKFRDAAGIASNAISDTIILGNNIAPATPNAKSEVTLYRAEGDNRVYVIKDGKKQWIKTAEEFISAGYKWSDIVVTNLAVLAGYPDTDSTPSEVTLYRAEGDSKVYAVKDGVKTWIKTAAEFIATGYKWSDIKTTTPTALAAISDTPATAITSTGTTTLYQATGDNKVYAVRDGVKTWIKTAAEFTAAGYKWSDIKTTTPTALAAISDTPATAKVKVVNALTLRVRQSNTTSSAILGNVKLNEIFTVLEEKSGWYKITTSAGIIGWISGDYAEKQ